MSDSGGAGLQRGAGLSFRLGRIPVLVPWSGLLGVAVIAWLWWGHFELDPADPGQTAILAVVFAVLFYAAVLGHELAHAWVAGACGYPVHSITLWVLGGFTSYERRVGSAWKEGVIAASGPLASLLLGVAAGLVRDGTTDLRVYVVADALAWSNILLGIYNALPGLPLDGGAVVKAVVWGVTRNETTGTVVAAWGGRVVAVLVFLLPLGLAYQAGVSPSLSTVAVSGLIAAYLFAGANDALRRARVGARLPSLTAHGLARRAVVVAPDLPLSEALRLLTGSGAGGIVLVDPAGRPVAVSREESVSAVPVERRPWVPVSSVSASLDPRAVLRADLTGEPLLQAMAAHPASEYVLVDPATGALVGVLATSDVERALSA